MPKAPHNSQPNPHSNSRSNSQLDELLHLSLFRQHCPDANKLGEYQLGLLSEMESAHIHMHMQTCPHCREELNGLGSFLDDAPAAWKQVRDWAIQVLKEAGRTVRVVVRATGSAAHSPRRVGVTRGNARAATSAGQILRHIAMDGAEVEDLDMEVTVLTDPDQAEHGIVRVRAEVPSRWPELAGTGITASAGEWQAQGQTDDNGEVTFTGLPLTLLDQLRVEVSP